MASQKVIKPESVKNLSDFVARFNKASNLGYDPETREPTIYADAARENRVRSIPWKREADTLTILSNAAAFSDQARVAAQSRIDTVRAEKDKRQNEANAEMFSAETMILAAQREYAAALPADKSSKRRAILLAEASLREIQTNRTKPYFYKRYTAPEYLNTGVGIYMAPMPLDRRGISLVGTGVATAEVAPTEASNSAAAPATATAMGTA